ncbi:MAG: hypothetical protein IT434_10065 [Phycisphaerales bacterium]|nr:hypothetical protein [Phycisphaerales bacterium]
MTKLSITLSGEAFEALFPLRANHLNPLASWSGRDGDGCLFETYGADLEFVSAQDSRCIWTLIDSGTGKVCVVSGRRCVNRLGYLVSDTPLPAGVEVVVPIDVTDQRESDASLSSAAIHEMLATQHQIAIVWSIEDVHEVRPDLTNEQAWLVLQACKKCHDASVGVTWDTIEIIADDLFVV